MWTENIQISKEEDLEKEKETEIKLQTPLDHRKSYYESSRKTSTSATEVDVAEELDMEQQTGSK